tara:strand:- start:15392 stop:16831 length:1440 start_codon:yes stop_codon:yes gene_type:complete
MFLTILIGVPTLFLLGVVLYALTLRRVVPTNAVHIVQRGKQTVSYGVGQESGNVYYEFPVWLPVIGVAKRILPVSNFDIELKAYSAYDLDRVPFLVDVMAFFHIANPNKAAEKVESFEELRGQLTDVVRGAVRSILAKSNLEEIMGERPKYAKQFTEAVEEDLKSWGVESVKSIELMDVRDEDGSNVIHNIMAKRKSAIEKESRQEVAKNNQLAEQSELSAKQEIAVTKANTERLAGEALAESNQAIGIAKAKSSKMSGIADQEALSDIAKAARSTAEQEMEVVKVNQIKQAEIDKEREIIFADQEKRKKEIDAEARKYQVEVDAQAKLEAAKRQAEGTKEVGLAEAEVVLANGTSVAESKKLFELARVVAELTLAKDIGENPTYQDYLIRQAEVKVSEVIGVAQQEALGKALASADLKMLVNSGDVNSGISGFSDLLSSKGGSQVNGLLEALKQTPEGAKLLNLLNNLSGTDTPSSTN